MNTYACLVIVLGVLAFLVALVPPRRPPVNWLAVGLALVTAGWLAATLAGTVGPQIGR